MRFSGGGLIKLLKKKLQMKTNTRHWRDGLEAKIRAADTVPEIHSLVFRIHMEAYNQFQEF